MSVAERYGDAMVEGMRWSARLVGLVATALFLQLVIDWSPTAILKLPWSSATGMPLFLALLMSVAGVLIAWRWQTAGGVMASVGAIGIIFLVYLRSGSDLMIPALVMAAPLLIPGALYLACSGWTAVTSLPAEQSAHQP